MLLKKIVLSLTIVLIFGTLSAQTTETICASGCDRTTVTLWEANLSTGSQIGQMSDEAFDELVVIDDADPSEITLEPASGTAFDGTAGSGPRFVQSAANTSRMTVTAPAATGITIDRIEFDGNGNRRDSYALHLNEFGAGSDNQIGTGLIVHDIAATSQTTSGLYSDFSNCQYINCIVYDISVTTGILSAVRLKGSGGTADAINVTVFKAIASTDGDAIGVDEASSGTLVKNVISMDSDIDFTDGSGTHSNNLSSDATAPGSGSLISKSSTNQFVSTTNGSEDFNLKTGADAIDAGTDTGAPATDIVGTSRSSTDMGAFEFVAAGPGATPATRKTKVIYKF